MIRIIPYVLLFAMSLVTVGARPAHALDAADLPKAIENAKTPADHEAIAAYFDEQAKGARATAEMHRKMGATYKKESSPPPKSGGAAHLFHTQMGEHCDDLATKYEKVAKDYEAMAAEHRAQAKAAR